MNDKKDKLNQKPFQDVLKPKNIKNSTLIEIELNSNSARCFKVQLKNDM